MPTWKRHVVLAKRAGLDEDSCRNVSILLDAQKPHRALHNTSGVAMAFSLYGAEGARCAVHHIGLDAATERTMSNLTPRDRILFTAMLKLQK